MPKKFDTNPLDPEFPKKVVEAQRDETAYKLTAETRHFPINVETDEQTRRFDEAQFNPMFNPPDYQPPAVYQTTRFAELQPIDRKVEKVGLPENVLVALPYLPFGIGFVAGLVELLIVPSSEPKVRFHAAQGFALHIGIFLITTILSILDNFSGWIGFGNFIFWVSMMVCSIVWAVKAYKGKPIHIESVDELTNFLEEKIKIK